MSSLLALVSVLAIVISGTTAGTTAGAAPPIDGRLVDARSGVPIAGAEITIVGRSGSVRTDALATLKDYLENEWLYRVKTLKQAKP